MLGVLVESRGRGRGLVGVRACLCVLGWAGVGVLVGWAWPGWGVGACGCRIGDVSTFQQPRSQVRSLYGSQFSSPFYIWLANTVGVET